MKKYIFTFLVTSLIMLSFSTSDSLASEGDFTLSNRIGTGARCWARSVWLDQYNILTTCEDISYPSGAYIVWVQPSAGGNPQRIGALEFGKKLFKTKTTFGSIFVTLEESTNPTSPSGTVVMSGSARPIGGGTNPAPVTEDELNAPSNELGSAPSPVSRAAQGSESESNGSNVFRVLATGGILSFLALFGVILVVFVITRR